MRTPSGLPALLAGLCLASVLAACDVLGQLGSTVVPLEVWNRTLDPVFLVDETGRRIDVPACGHAEAQSIDVDHVMVHTEVGYVYGFGTRGPSSQYLVLVALDGESELTTSPPLSIPACQGHPNAQPGVFLP